MSINHYGASAQGASLFEKFGFTAQTVVAAARESLEATKSSTAATKGAPSGPSGPADTQAHSGVTIS